MTGDLVPGARVGDYVLERELAARVGERAFAAKHVMLPRQARLVMPAFAEAAVPVMREACILEAIRHPSVPRIYECGLLPDRRPWIAVELIVGLSLAELPPFGIADVVTVLAECSAILEHAHGRDVTHRGLDANAVIHAADGLCIPDWSTATFDAHDDHTDDIRALGALAYRLLTRAEPSLPLARRCPSAPPRLARLVDRMLAAQLDAAGVCKEAERITDDLALPLLADDGVLIEEVDVELIDISS